MRARLLLAAVLLSACTAPSVIARRSYGECARVEGPRPWSYCIQAAEGKRKDVIYYLHGAGGDETTWAERDSQSAGLRQRWKDIGVEAPAVVAVSFGPAWLLVEKNASGASGLLEQFTDEIMPTIEARLGKPERRFLLGESMGAFNASQLVLKRGALFDRAALLCPGFSLLPPYPGDAELEAYLEQTRASRFYVQRIFGVMRPYFPDNATWDGSDPVALASKKLGAGSPKLYVSCGRSDEYGFFDAASQFAAAAREKGVPTVWKPVDGGHCSVDLPSVADFLGS